jgi:hypothetical protein
MFMVEVLDRADILACPHKKHHIPVGLVAFLVVLPVLAFRVAHDTINNAAIGVKTSIATQ